MAGIYSQGGSAGHRYAGWLSEVEAKNFIFGGKVFNGSPSAIYVGSNLVWFAPGLTGATQRAIVGAFGQTDGMAVINATNAYLNQLAASDMDKATALAGFINTYAVEDAHIVYSLVPTLNVARGLVATGSQYIIVDTSLVAPFDIKIDATSNQATGWMGANGVCQIRYSSYATVGVRMIVRAVRESTTTNYYFGGVLRESNSYNYSGQFWIFNMYGYWEPCKATVYSVDYKDSNSEKYLVPFIRNGVNGMIDVLDGTFYANAGSGSFTISETPSTP